MMTETADALLEIDKLSVEFDTGAGLLRAVDGVSYSVRAGETVAVVGESGSGKSVTALAVLGLLPSPPGRVVGGAVRWRGENLLAMDERQLQTLRGREIGMVFQEPMTSLNPLLSIGRQLTETLRQHLGMRRAAARARALELLDQVGIADAERRLDQYPHQLSGGQRQRVMIAIALSCEPQLLIADEPTTALDVTIQAQVLALLQDLSARRERGFSLVLITHNLGIVARYADAMNVMYAGRVVEAGPAGALYQRPAHPYTLGLLNSVPRLDRPRQSKLEPVPGQAPDLTRPPSGCAFRPRCAFADARCAEPPPLVEVVSGQRVACWHAERVQAQSAAVGEIEAAS